MIEDGLNGDLTGYDTAENAQANFGYQRQLLAGRRLFSKGEESRIALQQVLATLDCGVSLSELKRAIATIEAHTRSPSRPTPSSRRRSIAR